MMHIRQMGLSDAEDLLALELRNREFFQNYTGLRNEEFYTLAGQKRRIMQAMSDREKDQAYSYLIEDDQTIIGLIALTGVLRHSLQSAWIGYFLDKEMNGRGYMTEAVKQVVEIAFSELKLHRLEAGVMPHNIRSMRVLEKAGFEKEGIARKNVKINGKWEDHMTLSILNPEDI
ncbi:MULTISPECIES: GNAT family N-acetyltransferase [Listeria]|uniref:GNAT family N-acetyltransferase n=2 Tax=Listeria TaxID=1637 RepID=UPI000B58E7F0|nr:MULTISPECIES: GNAT family protein [Listeria]